MRNITISETTDIQLECTITDDSTVKLFIWDTNQRPLHAPFEL